MRRNARLLLVLPLLLVPLSGCSNQEASAAELLAGAPAATMQDGTARTELVIDAPGLVGGEAVRLTASGAVDFTARRATLTMDMGPMLAGSGLDGVDASVELIQDGSLLYLRSPLFSRGFGGLPEGQWLGIDTEAAAAERGLGFDQLQQLGGNDPRQGLALLTGVSDEVEKIGEEEVRGTSTTRYRAVVDLEKALAESGAVTDAEQFRRLVEQFELDEVTVEAWIDGEDRVRRIELPLPAPAAEGAGRMVTTVDYFDFGAAVEITAPPAEQVTALHDLLTGTGAEPSTSTTG